MDPDGGLLYAVLPDPANEHVKGCRDSGGRDARGGERERPRSRPSVHGVVCGSRAGPRDFGFREREGPAGGPGVYRVIGRAPRLRDSGLRQGERPRGGVGVDGVILRRVCGVRDLRLRRGKGPRCRVRIDGVIRRYRLRPRGLEDPTVAVFQPVEQRLRVGRQREPDLVHSAERGRRGEADFTCERLKVDRQVRPRPHLRRSRPRYRVLPGCCCRSVGGGLPSCA